MVDVHRYKYNISFQQGMELRLRGECSSERVSSFFAGCILPTVCFVWVYFMAGQFFDGEGVNSF